MGEIADMMLDGTMDCETGEWNFDGEDGPGFPMTGAQARAFKRGRPVQPALRTDDAALLKRREKRRRQRRNKTERLKAERKAAKADASKSGAPA